MFSTEHFIWIGLCAAFVAGLLIFSLKSRLSFKFFGCVMVAICAFSEISKIMSDMEESAEGGMVLDPKSLPFHLCSLMIFVILFIVFGKDGRAKDMCINFFAVAGILGSVCAILIPTNGTDFADIRAYQCFVYHAGLLWFALYLICSKRTKLGIASARTNMLILLSLVPVMLYVNSALSAYGTNFMYLVRPPMEDLPFLNLDNGWYVYFLHLVSLGAVIICLFHLPFIIAEKIEERGFLIGEDVLIDRFGKEEVKRLKKEDPEAYKVFRNSPTFMPTDVVYEDGKKAKKHE